MQPLAKARIAILELLENNDNTDNKVCQARSIEEYLKRTDSDNGQFTESYYIATALSALGNILGSAPDPRASTAIEKAVTFDRLIPSYANVVTRAGMQVGHSYSLVLLRLMVRRT